MTIKQVTKKPLQTLALAGAAVCLANAAHANTYTLLDNPPGPLVIEQVWMHTFPGACQAVDWHGVLTSGSSLTLQSDGACGVDRIEINGITLFSMQGGIASTGFYFCGGGAICVSPRRRHR